MKNPRVLLIGRRQRGEFLATPAALQERCEVTWSATLPEALQSHSEHPDLQAILLLQSVPGEYRALHVDELRRRYPLARMVVVLGSWLQGETRTGRPLAGAIRIDWHRAEAVIDRELRAATFPRLSPWALPATSTPDERALVAAANLFEIPLSGLAVIAAGDRATGEALADVCAATGLATVQQRSSEPFDVRGASLGLWDGAASATGMGQLRRLCERLDPSPVIALIDAPRRQEIRAATTHGAASVVGKPLMASDLLFAIRRVLSPAGSAERVSGDRAEFAA